MIDRVIEAFARRSSLRTERAPVVSIVIPVYNELESTLRCLLSLAEIWFEALDVEIIVVDDCSTDATASALARIAGITVVRNARNLGYLLSSNNGTALARGTYVCYLNNDTIVTAGWLDRLVEAAENNSTIGAVGAKLVYPDGTLQEAGTILWNDGTGWQYGNGATADDPLYGFARDVDYASAAALLVRASVLARVGGGFDPRYAPAYYEDSDLCMAIRQLGYRVVYQPRSTVVHVEGLSHGSDPATGLKRFEAINREKFVQKWRAVLAREHLPNDPDTVYRAARLRNAGMAVALVGESGALDESESGRRLRRTIGLLHGTGLRLVVLTVDFRPARPFTRALQDMGVEVLYVCSDPPTAEQRITQLFQSLDVAWIFGEAAAERYAAWLRVFGNVKIVYDAPAFAGDSEVVAAQRSSLDRYDAIVAATSEDRTALAAGGVARVYEADGRESALFMLRAVTNAERTAPVV